MIKSTKIGLIVAAALGFLWLRNQEPSGAIKTQQVTGGAVQGATSVSVQSQGKTTEQVRAAAVGSPAGWLQQWAAEPDPVKRRNIKQSAFNKAKNAGLAFESESTVNGIPLPEVFGAWMPPGNQPAFYSLANYIKLGFKFSGSGIHEPGYAKAVFRPVFEDWAAKYGMPLNW